MDRHHTRRLRADVGDAEPVAQGPAYGNHEAVPEDQRRHRPVQGVPGELGGPPAMLAGLLGEMAGIEQAPAEWSQKDGSFAVRFGDLIDVEVANQTGGLPDPVQLVNVFHPANTTLTVSPATKSKVDVFGVRFDGTGTSGFNAPFAWSA